MQTPLLALALTLAPVAAPAVPLPPGPKGPLATHVPPTEPGIAWFGTWEGALAEAKRTQRPILFMSAAPQCHEVPGVW